MKTTQVTEMIWLSALSLAALCTKLAVAQNRMVPYSGRGEKSGAVDDSGQVSAVLSGPNLRVSKSAFVDGHEVCGVIRIVNGGGEAATITGLADSLEVHFPRGATPTVPPPVGSTVSWYKVADVPLSFALPANVDARATVTIDYCFSLCQAADYIGANSMRNVVTVSATDSAGAVRSFTTRSVSFPPPVLDCQACCLPDGSCTDTVPDACESGGGLSQGSGSDCATTECPEACCLPDDSCTDDPPSVCEAANGEPQGPGTNCASTQCCAPLRIPNSCDETGDCCSPTAKCLNSECCILTDALGCNSDSDCCTEGQTCEGGTCCAPMRVPNTCDETGDCCNPTAKCLNSECCILTDASGCNSDSDCCTEGQVCDGGTCCAPMRVPNTCDETGDCCNPTAKCLNSECCILNGVSGCNLDSDCCTEGQTCVAGVCCRDLFGSCVNDLDCCSGLVCSGGLCDRLIGP